MQTKADDLLNISAIVKSSKKKIFQPFSKNFFKNVQKLPSQKMTKLSITFQQGGVRKNHLLKFVLREILHRTVSMKLHWRVFQVLLQSAKVGGLHEIRQKLLAIAKFTSLTDVTQNVSDNIMNKLSYTIISLQTINQCCYTTFKQYFLLFVRSSSSLKILFRHSL